MPSLLQLTTEQYITARDGLIEKDLIAFDGTLFQVLQLPQKPLPHNQSSVADQKMKTLRPSPDSSNKA
jgi:hypothetical protein